METEFKPGDKVCNKAKPSEILILLRIEHDSIAICYDSNEKERTLPLVVLEKYNEPKPPTITARNVW